MVNDMARASTKSKEVNLQTIEKIEFNIRYIKEFGHFSRTGKCPSGIDDTMNQPFDKKRNVVTTQYINDLALMIVEVEEEFKLPPKTLLPLIRYESGFRTWVNGDGGKANGLMQIREDYHRKRFDNGSRAYETVLVFEDDVIKEFNFKWSDDRDKVRYAAWMIKKQLLSGRNLYSAISPWSCRPKAWKEYKRIKES
jgi:hypothetical protein